MSGFQRLAARHFGATWFECPSLPDGTRVMLRPLGPGDALLLREAVLRLSERSRYLRFHGPKTELSDEELRHLTDVDGEERLALGAFSGQQLVGVGQFFRGGAVPDAADLALTVADPFQGRGLGALLLARLRLAALERGIARFTGQVLDENRPMLGLLRKLHARLGLPSWGVRSVDLPLS